MTFQDTEETSSVQPSTISKFQAFRASKWFIGITVFGASLTDGFLYGMVVPVLPFSLVNRSGVDPERVQFWNSTLLVTFGASMCVSCAILSWSTKFKYSRRAPLFVGLGIDVLSTILFMLVKRVPLLVLSRVLQGLGSGLLFSAGLALMAEAAPPEEAGSWIGFALSGADIGILTAPLLAGHVYERAGYHWVFAIGLVVIAIESVLVTAMVNERDEASDEASIEHSHSSTAAWIDPQASEATLFPPSDETAPLLAGHKSTSPPAVPSGFSITLQLLRTPQIATAVYGALIALLVVTSFDATLPIFVHDIFNWQSGLAGTMFLAISLPSLLAAAVGALTDKYGARRVAVSGCVVSIVSLAALAFIHDNTTTHKIIFSLLLVAIGMGYNLFLVSLAADLGGSVELMQDQFPSSVNLSAIYTQVYALQGYSLALGTMFGPLISGAIFQASSWAVECGVLAVIVATATIPIMLYTRNESTS